MDSSNLSLKNGVDKTVARKHILALELGGNDHSLECLTTAAYRYEASISPMPSKSCIGMPTRQILNLHMLSL